MITKKQRLSVALSASLTVMTLAPLSAMADPEGMFSVGKCGNQVVGGFVEESTAANQIQDQTKVVKLTLPIATSPPSNGGLVIRVLSLKPVSQTGSGWQSLDFRANTGEIPTDSIFAVLHFDFPGQQPDEVRVIPLNTFPGNPGTKSGWRTFSINNRDIGGFGRTGLLKQLSIVARNNWSSPRVFKVGKTNINHFGQGSIDGNLLFKTVGTCGEIK